ncbi:hypothetical protein CWI38_0761p0040 [Hamiltosporidium tvaerminnensis]|uniref:Uncharacterized protein n=1 Tax=Hamiltosporidium tvaerminnensis TaxID=1176355 RepID=A0A4Q9LVM3_9MICR|nr:hypothetical protein CWI38_0761p0040 [Hamiltosporidium tvaerminnensis]
MNIEAYIQKKVLNKTSRPNEKKSLEEASFVLQGATKKEDGGILDVVVRTRKFPSELVDSRILNK